MKHRKIGYYNVCHPYSMSESVVGYWDGKWWRFKDDPDIISADGGMFDDDDLMWIDDKKLLNNSTP
jgi:hypothetical protein